MHEDELQQIGLSEKEAKVYISALELGKASAQEVAKKSGLKRPTTYFTMEALMKKGLMSSVYEGKKQFFMAENPDRLVDVFQTKQDELKRQGEKLKKVIPNLRKLAPQTEGGPVVKYYTGKEGALSMAKSILQDTGDGNIWMAYDSDKVHALFTEEQNESVRFQRAKSGVHINAFYTTSGPALPNTETSTRVKIEDGLHDLNADIAVYGNNVRLTDLGDDVVGIVVNNKNIADAMRRLFRLAWKKHE